MSRKTSSAGKDRFSPVQRLLHFIAGTLGYWVIRFYFLTIHSVNEPRSRKVFNRTAGPPGIYPFWHAHQLAALVHYDRTRAAIMVSRSRDGEYIARIARRVGFLPVRGSSSRAGAPAFKEMLHLARAGRTIAITPDGPRGPRYSINPGVINLACKSGYPIIPFAPGLSDFWELPTWDRFRIPKPFAVSYGCWGDPLHVPPDADEQLRKKLAAELRRRMIALEKRADRMARLVRRSRGRVELPDIE